MRAALLAALLSACSSPFATATATDAGDEPQDSRASALSPESERFDADPDVDAPRLESGGAPAYIGESGAALPDATTPADASDDTAEIPAPPPDAGETSRSSDASFDAVADATTDATVEAPHIEPDAARVDAPGPPTCTTRYGYLPGFSICEDAGSTCEFRTSNTALPCSEFCGTCGVSWSSSGTCSHGSPYSCSLSLPGSPFQICRCTS